MIQNFYPTQALPVILMHAVNDIAVIEKVPTEMAAAAILTAASIACQSHVKVKLPISGALRPTSLGCCCVAASGTGKTPSIKAAMQAVEEYDKAAVESQMKEVDRYEALHQIWKMERKKILRSAPAANLEKLLTQHFAIEPKKPSRRPLLSTDISELAVISALEGTGNSMCVLVDEGEILLKESFLKSVGTLNSAWSGGPLRLERANGVRITADDTRITMFFAVQPHVFEHRTWKKSLGTLRGSGFLARFLMLAPPSLQGSRYWADWIFRREGLDKFHQRIREILTIQLNSVDALPRTDIVHEFDADASNRWINIGNSLEASTSPNAEFSEIADFVAKAPEIIARLAALLHHFSAQPGKITADTVERAYAIVSFHLYEARKIFVAPPQWIQDCATIDDYLCRSFWSKGVQFIQKNHVLRNGPIRTGSRLDMALSALASRGRLWITTDARRTTYIWGVNPSACGVPQAQPPSGLALSGSRQGAQE